MSLDYSIDVPEYSLDDNEYYICKDFIGDKLRIDLNRTFEQLYYYAELFECLFPMFEFKDADPLKLYGLIMDFKKSYMDRTLVVNQYKQFLTGKIIVALEYFDFTDSQMALYIQLHWRPVNSGFATNDRIFYSNPEMNRYCQNKFKTKNFIFKNKEFKECLDNFFKISAI